MPLGLGKACRLPWFEFNAADRHIVRRLATVPQHDRGGFVGGDALDNAAPINPVKLAWALVVVERGCDARGELYSVPSLDHLQSLSGMNAQNVAQRANNHASESHRLQYSAVPTRYRNTHSRLVIAPQ